MRFFSLSCGLSMLVAAAYAPAVRSTPPQPAGVHLVDHPVSGAPAGITAFVDVAVVPMDQERVLPHQTLLVDGGRIIALGPVDRVRVPAGAVRIESRGKYLIPGLADMHAHVFQNPHIGSTYNGEEVSDNVADSAGAQARLFLWLANGVTTIRNLDYVDYIPGEGGWGPQTLRLRARAATGQAWIPRIYTAGEWGPYQYLGSDDSTPRLDSVAAYIAAYKARGYDFIKVHDEPPAVLDSVLAAARRIGLPVVGHVPAPVHVEHILPLGYRSIEHPLTAYLWGGRTKPARDDTIGFRALAGAVRRANVWHCPTQSHYDRWHYFDDPTLGKVLKVEQDSGVSLLLGTDEVPWQGVITRELQAFVAAGLTPYQALLTGTRNVAAYFGTLQESGTIMVGKRADLVLLTGNPLQDVRYTAQPAGVMLGGRWLSREEIVRHVAGLTLATPAPWGVLKEQPVKSYWQNVANQEAIAATANLFTGIELTQTQKTRLEQLWKAHEVQQRVLLNSLGASDHYEADTHRVFHLIARQLGEYRQMLTPDQQMKFDECAKKWLRRRKLAGWSDLAIPGVQ